MRLLRASPVAGQRAGAVQRGGERGHPGGGRPRIEAQHLPEAIRDPEGKGGPGLQEERYKAPDSADERAAIVAALEEAGGSRSRAAELLGMSRTTLWRRMKDFGLGDEG